MLSGSGLERLEMVRRQAMSRKTYTKVACGINSSASDVWAVQNYSR
jgi:hypothetical protein